MIISRVRIIESIHTMKAYALGQKSAHLFFPKICTLVIDRISFCLKANKCDLKAGSMLALNKQYERAVQLFEGVASHACESSLLKYSAKEYFFKAALCHFWDG